MGDLRAAIRLTDPTVDRSQSTLGRASAHPSLLASTLDGLLPVCTVTDRRVGADDSDVGYRDRLRPHRASAAPAAPRRHT